MTAPAPGRRCGTCKHWRDYRHSKSECLWTAPDAPIWLETAAIYMNADDGLHCRAWKEDPK